MRHTAPVERVRVFAPGGIGNMGPGLDVLGCAITGAGDTVDLEWSDDGCASTIRIDDAGHPDLPTDPARHAASIAALAVLHASGRQPTRCLVMRAHKGLPLAGGQGGSAASAVAGAVAMNALLGAMLDESAVLAAALDAEAAVAGRHADNVAPALLGGVVLVRTLDPLDVVRLPFPSGLRVVLVQPRQRLRTSDARAVLPQSIDRELFIRQSANIAAVVAALATNDLDLLRRALDDRIAEPVRAPLLPGFADAKVAALAHGALGCSISGAGPTSFAFAPDDATAHQIAHVMCSAYASHGVLATSRLARIDERGARLLPSDHRTGETDLTAEDAEDVEKKEKN
jgi:homoserine kinase